MLNKWSSAVKPNEPPMPGSQQGRVDSRRRGHIKYIGPKIGDCVKEDSSIFGYNYSDGASSWLLIRCSGRIRWKLFVEWVMSGISNFRTGLFLLTLVLAVLVTACGSSQPQIAFVSEVDGDQEIYTLDPDDGTATVITDNLGRDFDPRWSPDGRQLIYISDEAGDLEVNLADDKGKAITRLTHSPGDDQYARWSPEGDRIAFVSLRDGTPEVYLTDAEGGRPTRVTSNLAADQLGDWSSNGEWLVFFRTEWGEEQGLWLRNPDGVNVVHLTTEQDTDPAWSPNGDHIVFVRRAGSNSDIYIVSRLKNKTWQDDSELTRLTQHPEDELSPAWSPNSKTIAFVSYRDGNAEIYTMDTDGSKQLRFTNNQADDLTPVWSPDGKRIAFVSHLYGAGEIFVMNADGTRQQRLTNNNSEDHSPDW